ncbi:hypothetical protein AGABI2DRAFT_119054 [Agaricus bisporus var. bisporus H97]|uniref:hypothetical protein n=1 Tax=Agaricus bisporus var. bisporus (strain H97 / ATCC MYA-4626 / FGSC 10389) TaxID=936046 RepID=UPI00029F780C|nr:hypothetical protein AGABI2DRAFT_119054 [Agaricus bisporus var. bisporus H97]EKV46876.1 hypothetical protein AGABI2DRAFT_119054 [Agaricus bisporus var. bisporus H97]
MATQQPLVCTSLHLPPDSQPFLRIHEIYLHVFLPNLDALRLALEADQAIMPGATEIFAETRKVLRQELLNAAWPLHFGQEVAERYSRVLEALSERNPTHDPLYKFYLSATGAAYHSEEAQKAMSVFRDEFASAVSRVRATLDANYKMGSKTPLTSPENMKSILEILNATDECNVLFRQCRGQFASLATRTRDKNSIDLNSPSEEEIQVIGAKWQTFYYNVRGLWFYAFKIANRIQYPILDRLPNASEKRKSGQKFRSWRTLFRRQDKRDLVCSTNALRSPADPEVPFIDASNSSPDHELQMNPIP